MDLMMLRLLPLIVTGAALALAQPAAAPKKTAAAKPAAAKKSAPPKATAASTKPDPNDPVVLEVGTEKITRKQFEKLVESLPDQYRNAARGARKREFADQVASMKALAQEAQRRKLDQAESFKTQVAFQYENLLANALFTDIQKTGAVPASEVQKYYDDHKNEYEEATARHILIRFKGSPVPVKEGQKDLTEEEALAKVVELRKQITGGANFAELAKKESDDSVSGGQGGDLGKFGRGRMVPVFEETAFKQPIGQLSEPVKSQFGYHLIEVTARESKTFDQVKEQIEGQLRPQRAKKAIDDVKTAAGVKVNDAYFGAPAAPAAPPVQK